MQEDAFRNAQIKELYIRHCGLVTINPLAFGGLENSLQVLDLSGNRISNTSERLFKSFDYLRWVTRVSIYYGNGQNQISIQ